MKEFLAKSAVRIWLAIVGVAAILLITAYTFVQQEARLSANDQPQDTAQVEKHQLENGAQPSDVVPTVKTDLSSDSSVFVTVTDSSEHVLASSASLDGSASLPPANTFVFTKQHGSDHFTWQPRSGVRLATYILPYGNSPNDGFIIAGQSLKQAEKRIETYTVLMVIAWLAVVAWTTFILIIPTTKKSK